MNRPWMPWIYAHFGADDQQTNDVYLSTMITVALAVGLTVLPWPACSRP